MRLPRIITGTRGVSRALLILGATLTTTFVLVAILAPWIAPYHFTDYATPDGTRFPRLAQPGGEHPLGTTVQALDVLSRTIWGAQTALQVVVLAVVFSLLIGVPLGLVSGYVGGKLDRVLVLVMDAIYAFPSLLLAIVISFLMKEALGGGLMAAAVAIAFVYVPQYFRIVRTSTLSAREATYVEAAKAIGARPTSIMRKYLFANVTQSVPVIATLNAADAILTLAGLGFLGYGVDAAEASEWGYDLQRSLSDVGLGIWWTALFPGLALVGFVLGLTLLGEAANESLNPTLQTPVRHRFRFPTVTPSPSPIDLGNSDRDDRPSHQPSPATAPKMSSEDSK
jgi:peptide/nickel transport system permease protein